MEHVWNKIAALRKQYAVLCEDQTPIDIFSFFEIDLGLNPIPFDDLTAKYQVDAEDNASTGSFGRASPQ